MNRFYLYIFICLFSATLLAGGEDRQNYIDTWKESAITQMEKYGIPASITLAQGILESGNGMSMLTREANNHFGIKCHGWDGPGVYHDDDKRGECFRKYASADDSFEDHSLFLMKRRYAGLFELSPTDYKGWAKGLKKAGYATDPQYAHRLIRLIEDNRLNQYDNGLIVARREFEATKPKHDGHTTASESTDVIDLRYTREVLMHPNRIKFVKAKKGDDVQRIALELDMSEWQIKKYNDLDSRTTFQEGEMVFIQPKKKKSKIKFHKAVSGESLKDISQNYGVNLKSLKKYNRDLPPDKAITSGVKVYLRKPPS